MATESASQVQYMYQPGGPFPGPCGYCHGDDQRFCLEGVWSEKMSAQDFQELVDRGCQRSGKFVYLPSNRVTCCPQYILRLDVSSFRVSKSQRRVIRRFNEYLRTGQMTQKPSGEEGEGEGVSSSSPTRVHGQAPCGGGEEGKSSSTTQISQNTPPTQAATHVKRHAIKPGKGADPTKPPCRKAKELRRERREIKLATKRASGESMETGGTDKPVSKKAIKPSTPTDLTDLVRLPDMNECKRKLDVKLICASPAGQEFWETYQNSYDVFRKFQMVIHKEPEHKCDRQQYLQFLVSSPLYPEESPPGTGLKYGSYHQQYWLDNQLIMVGVLDIIPKGVLCNYLFYDPDVRFLAPGVYSALREIAFNQELYQHNPAMQYYYMGYYVHDCPKMNYKRNYDSAYVLCSESLGYIPLEKARIKLNEAMERRKQDQSLSKHVQLTDQTSQQESLSEEDVNKVLVVVDEDDEEKVMEYGSSKTFYGNRYDELVRNYLQMVGKECAHRMHLHFP